MNGHPPTQLQDQPSATTRVHAPLSLESLAVMIGGGTGVVGLAVTYTPLVLQALRSTVSSLGQMDPDHFFDRCWQPMVLYIVCMALWTPTVQLLSSVFPAGPWRRVAVDAESTLGGRVGWASLQMVLLMAALLTIMLLHSVGCAALLTVRAGVAGGRTWPTIAAPPNITPSDLQLQQLQWNQQSQEARIEALMEMLRRGHDPTAATRPTPPTEPHTDPTTETGSTPPTTPHTEPGTHSPPPATAHAEPAPDTRSTPDTVARHAAEPATMHVAVPPGGCLVAATFTSFTALYAQNCVSTHLLNTNSAYSNTLTSARSFGSLYAERHGAGTIISRNDLLRDGDGLLPTFFGEWWDPSLGTLLVEMPRV